MARILSWPEYLVRLCYPTYGRHCSRPRRRRRRTATTLSTDAFHPTTLAATALAATALTATTLSCPHRCRWRGRTKR